MLFLFCVEYLSMKLCQQFRPSLMHRVGPTSEELLCRMGFSKPVRHFLHGGRSKTNISFDTYVYTIHIFSQVR